MAIQTLSPKISTGSIVGQAVGQGLQSGLSQSLNQSFQRSQLQKGLQAVRGLAGRENVSPFELASSLMEATAGIPGAEKYVGQLFPLLLQQSQAKQSQNAPVAGEMDGEFRQQRQLPGFMGAQQTEEGQEQQGKFFPSNIGPQEAPGNVPQPATEGVARPIYSVDQLIPKAKTLAKARSNVGIPTSVPQALEELKAANEENKVFNSEVEKERQQRVQSQRESGEMAAEKLIKVLPGATDEQKAIFRKIGEDLRGRSPSEADFDRGISKEATKFKNTIENVKRDLDAPRLFNSIQRRFMGTDKDFKQASNDLRVKLKPLLDLGLYDTARNLLESKGFYPEERESVINPLTEKSQTAVNLVPSAKGNVVKTTGPGIYVKAFERLPYTPAQKEFLKEGIQQALKDDSNASLVLLRKAFEDKGYDWRIFKDAINELVTLGKEGGGVDLNDDQFNQSTYLDSPPLNTLERILHGLNIIGR